MTPIAHAVRFAIRCGIGTIASLADELECTQSAIYRAIKQLQASDPTVTVSDGTVTSQYTATMTAQSLTDPTVTENDPTVTGTEIETRAPKELPNGNTSYEDTSMHACSAHASEIEGLNGSTGAFTTQLATLLAGPLGSPDFQTAKQILESNVRSFGAERVRIAMAEWSVRVQTDRQFRATPSSFGKFVQSAKIPGNVVDFEPDWKRKRREQSARIDAMLEALPQ